MNNEKKQKKTEQESSETTGTEPTLEVGTPPEGTGHAPDLGETTGTNTETEGTN